MIAHGKWKKSAFKAIQLLVIHLVKYQQLPHPTPTRVGRPYRQSINNTLLFRRTPTRTGRLSNFDNIEVDRLSLDRTSDPRRRPPHHLIPPARRLQPRDEQRAGSPRKTLRSVYSGPLRCQVHRIKGSRAARVVPP